MRRRVRTREKGTVRRGEQRQEQLRGELRKSVVVGTGTVKDDANGR